MNPIIHFRNPIFIFTIFLTFLSSLPSNQLLCYQKILTRAKLNSWYEISLILISYHLSVILFPSRRNVCYDIFRVCPFCGRFKFTSFFFGKNKIPEFCVKWVQGLCEICVSVAFDCGFKFSFLEKKNKKVIFFNELVSNKPPTYKKYVE